VEDKRRDWRQEGASLFLILFILMGVAVSSGGANAGMLEQAAVTA
jgi:hypothetical protein